MKILLNLKGGLRYYEKKINYPSMVAVIVYASNHYTGFQEVIVTAARADLSYSSL